MRRAKIEDVPTLLKLARMVHFINLPAEPDIITEKTMWSAQCFARAAALGDDGRTPPDRAEVLAEGRSTDAGASGLAKAISSSPLFMFVLEETQSAGVVGTSQIIAKMGGPGHPNVSFQLLRKEMFSSTLQYGATHIVAKLHLDETGPTEIGGLILQPSFRGHRLRLGRFLSHIRFHFMALYRPLFSDRVLAELMAPITPDGRNTLWEYLGRRFINLTYTEADRFCQYSKEFMTSLLPREEIYLTLLPPEARSVVGQVGPETAPARRMLERLGFEYRDRIDPFDGGPHLEAQTEQISLVRDTRRAELGEPAAAPDCKQRGIVSAMDADGEFRAVETDYAEARNGRLRLPRESMEALHAEPGQVLGLTPSPQRAPAAPGGGAAPSTKSKRAPSGKGRRTSKRPAASGGDQ